MQLKWLAETADTFAKNDVKLEKKKKGMSVLMP